MPITLDTFKAVAGSTAFAARDIAVRGEGKTASAKLGNFVFSQGKAVNDATMAAFKSALEKEYGVFGRNAFDTILGSRHEMHKSLRACDVRQTLSNLATIRNNRYMSELQRQFDTSPLILELTDDAREKVRAELNGDKYAGIKIEDCRTAADVAAAAQKRIEKAVSAAAVKEGGLAKRGDTGEWSDAGKIPRSGTDPTGLDNLKTVFAGKETSVADLVKRGLAGEGMRVNRSGTNPVILEKLKTNGVEPGFIYRNDWSADDTRGLLSDIDSPGSRAALEELKAKDPAFAAKCEGKSLRAQIMLAGRAHPACMSAVAEFVLETAAQMAKSGNVGGNDGFARLAKAMRGYFSNEADVIQLADGTRGKALLDEAKRAFFAQIRDAVIGVGKGDDFYGLSPVFRHFSERHIVKLDYNESDKFSKGAAAHAGTFMRPERILTSRKPVLGQIYRLQTAHSADSISAGAVTEALANDLTRAAGVPSQEMEIVRGEYSDGHPKLMLAAKFADGYKDMEAGLLKDGRIVSPDGQPLEKLGKYKAFFLVTADRDAIGRRGQNKGFAHGRFFAIDPGHSLEGSGKYLKISSDLSFKDTYGKSTKPRFENFSVFDDDTFFSKMEGVLELREKAEKGVFRKIFAEYRARFDPDEAGISDAEKTLRTKIRAGIDKKEAEFNESVKKILDVAGNNLQLFDDLADRGGDVQRCAIETVSNLEKLTSPTTWVSRKGKVALEHLEVLPETRVPWKAALKGENIVYYCETKLSGGTQSLLEGIAKNAGARYECDPLGFSRLVVPRGMEEAVFAAFSEENVQKLTHPEEYVARKEGGDGLEAAKTYRPAPYSPPKADPRPLLDPAALPDFLDVPVEAGGATRVVQIPKIHVAGLLSAHTHVHRPRDIGELRYLVECQIRRGNEVLGALMSGKTKLFEPTRENIVALTYAIHVAALRKGEFMYRGSFSIEDRDGNIARWLDRASDVYLRTSTHAKTYQALRVDGHLNMPRGYDVPNGAGGLLNGMRTFHYFTIPDTSHIIDAGGSGPNRRLFLKCETFGIFASTAHIHPFKMEDAKSDGMKTRGYRPGDLIESIRHGASLFKSWFTPKEAPGIRKENLTKAQKRAITDAVDKLNDLALDKHALMLTANAVLDGGGIKILVDNIVFIVEKMMPEDGEKRAALMSVLDELAGGLADAASNAGGEMINRIGNEIMIDAKDLM